jgi:hypothetical protein
MAAELDKRNKSKRFWQGLLIGMSIYLTVLGLIIFFT